MAGVDPVERERQVPLFEAPKSSELPPLSLLDEPGAREVSYSDEALEAMSRLVELKLRDFGVEAEVVAVQPGPVVTRFELRPAPGVKVSKDIASDARVRVEVPRAFFNELAKDGRVADWREAFMYGQAKATGPTQILQLIERVVAKQEERVRTKRARH